VRLRRLLSMGPAELACRSRQEVSKWLERASVVGRIDSPTHAILKNIAPGPVHDAIEDLVRMGNFGGAASMLLYRFWTAGSGRFFEGAVSDDTPALLAEHLCGTQDQAVAAADAACKGRFDLLGYRGLSFGDPIDWHFDPVSGRQAPLTHWSRINPLNKDVAGVSKVIWELNRHQWLVHLGQAYRLTGDERYAKTFVKYLRDWMQANPPGMGINWASSLEVALRLISWCWALFLFRGSKALSSELFLRLLEGIRAHAIHVEKYLSYYFAPNTHLTGEALGLFYAGVVFPELRPAGRWRELGARILVEQLERQNLPDGVYFEQSTCYQRYTAEIYLHFLILAARNGIEIPTTVQERVQRLLDFLLAIRLPDGSLPQIGDADGGWLLPLTPRAADDARSVFAIGAAHFGRPDYAWAAGGLAPETIWLLGPTGVKAYGALCPVPPETAPSRLFPDGGYAVMRSGWGPDAHQLIFDVGPLGCPLSGGHGHADLLSIQCSVFGEPYLVDSGTYCYAEDQTWRNFFRSTAAHSTIRVDGIEQAIPAGPFKWQSRPCARLHRWVSTEALDWADAEHDAYRTLPDPVMHHRRVLFVKPRYWVVVDDLKGGAEHQVELRFQFAPMEVVVDQTLWARARGAGGHGLLIRAFATVPLKTEILEGELAPIQGWVSHDYGQRQPAPVLIYSAVTCLPLRLVTLLLPIERQQVPPPAVSTIVGEGPDPLGLIFGEGQEMILVDEPAIVRKPQKRGDIGRGSG
jgi:heparinase II/III-like protein